jgi:hypothetical protein
MSASLGVSYQSAEFCTEGCETESEGAKLKNLHC